MPDFILETVSIQLDALTARCSELHLLLNAEEIGKAARFHKARDRLRYTARHGWMREQLAARLGTKPSALQIECDRFGKPYIPGRQIHFNLSHSHGVALLAINQVGPVGCDIEWRDPKLDFSAVAQQFFSVTERSALASLSPLLRREGFFRAWTSKEAYTKAVGRGLSIQLDSFDVVLDPDQPPALLQGCNGWKVEAFEPYPGFQAAVVALGQWRLVQKSS